MIYQSKTSRRESYPAKKAFTLIGLLGYRHHRDPGRNALARLGQGEGKGKGLGRINNLKQIGLASVS